VRWLRIVLKAGSSVDEGRRGTRDRMGYIVVVVVEHVDVEGEDGVGEFVGVRRGAKC